MIMRYLFILLILCPSLALSRPSQASFSSHLGLKEVAGSVKVIDARTTENENDQTFWLAMDSTVSTAMYVRIEAMEFGPDVRCDTTGCAEGYVPGREIANGERLLIMATKKITSITLSKWDGSDFLHYATINTPFANCQKDPGTFRADYVAWKDRSRKKISVAVVPLTARGEAIKVLHCAD